MTQLEYFRLLAPEYAGVIDATVNIWLGIAERIVNVAGMDAETEAMAIALYAAHMYRVTVSASSTMGIVESEKEGDLARSYAKLSGSDTWLRSTPYGQQFYEITRAFFGSSIMTRIA